MLLVYVLPAAVARVSSCHLATSPSSFHHAHLASDLKLNVSLFDLSKVVVSIFLCYCFEQLRARESFLCNHDKLTPICLWKLVP